MSNDDSHLVKGAIPPNTLIRPGSTLKISKWTWNRGLLCTNLNAPESPGVSNNAGALGEEQEVVVVKGARSRHNLATFCRCKGTFGKRKNIFWRWGLKVILCWCRYLWMGTGCRGCRRCKLRWLCRSHLSQGARRRHNLRYHRHPNCTSTQVALAPPTSWLSKWKENKACTLTALNGEFHFVFVNTSLKTILVTSIPPTERGHYVKQIGDIHRVSPLDLDRLHAVHTLEDSWIA